MIFKNIRDDIANVLRLDPAARSALEVVLCYPGFHAVVFHRVAHWLWERGWLVAGILVVVPLALTEQRERMLDLHGGMARKARGYPAHDG